MIAMGLVQSRQTPFHLFLGDLQEAFEHVGIELRAAAGVQPSALVDMRSGLPVSFLGKRVPQSPSAERFSSY